MPFKKYTKAQVRAYYAKKRKSGKAKRRPTQGRTKSAALGARSTAASRNTNNPWVILPAVRPPRLVSATKRAVLTYNYWEGPIAQLAGTIYFRVFRGNGVFDPDKTGGGNQPRYFDQYAALYQSVRVVASTCMVRFASQAQAAGQFVGLLSQGATGIEAKHPFRGEVSATLLSSLGQPELWSENPHITVAMGGHSTDNTGVLNLRKTLKTSQVLKTSSIPKDELLSSVGGHPTALWDWVVLVGQPGGSADTDLGNLQVSISYECIFSDPLPFSQS